VVVSGALPPTTRRPPTLLEAKLRSWIWTAKREVFQQKLLKAYRGPSGDRSLRKRAVALAQCANSWMVVCNPLRPAGARPAPFHCRDRLCPVCMAAQSARLCGIYGPLMDAERKKGPHRLKFITFTQLPIAGEGPRAARLRARKFFRRLTRRVYWKRNVRAWLASFEETYKDGRGWHAHIHVIAACSFLDQNELSEQWESCKSEERSSLVDIREARKGSERELLKYALKAADVPDECLAQYAIEMRGLRNASAGGDWFAVENDSKELELDEFFASGLEVFHLPYLVFLAGQGERWAGEALAAVRRRMRAPDAIQAVLPMLERPPP